MMFLIELDGIDDTLPPTPATALNKSDAARVFLNDLARSIAASNTCAGGCSLQYFNSSFAWHSVRCYISGRVQPVEVAMAP